jgi:transcriptional regulator with XRE-family HTH domain
VRSRCVPRRSGVNDRDSAPRSAEHESGTQTGRTAPDYHHVVALTLHGIHGARARWRAQFPLLFLGTASSVAVVAESPAIPDVLAEVGPRLKRLRLHRGVTLTALAATTGISKSTLSRLESGQRKPSLELLLPLAEFHQVPLDELVGAPDVGDPRIRFKPRVRNGRMVFPLTQQSSGLHVWKVVIPPERDRELRTHEGYEWLYVLSGQMRLVLGEHDITMGPGEVAEFDTRLPHWFGPADDVPVEILSVHGSHGQRRHVRAAPRRKNETV